jgi:putative SOS response-associated peptidase YedK
MCGRYNVTDSPVVGELMQELGMPYAAPRPQLNVSPGSTGEFVMEAGGDRHLVPGVWSMLIEPHPEGRGYRPNPKFHTFNARSDRLTSSPLWKKAYPSHRCVIPVSAVHEWQSLGEGRGKQVFNIHPKGEATALAGLWQSWHFGNEQVNSFTVITLPPHPRFSHIHPKSIPLMLRHEDFDMWLDPDFHQTDAFQGLMKSHIPAPLVCEPVKTTKDLTPIAQAEIIAKD